MEVSYKVDKENKVVVEQLDIFTNYETFNKQKEKT